jgi:hypothetical protein
LKVEVLIKRTGEEWHHELAAACAYCGALFLESLDDPAWVDRVKVAVDDQRTGYDQDSDIADIVTERLKADPELRRELNLGAVLAGLIGGFIAGAIAAILIDIVGGIVRGT